MECEPTARALVLKVACPPPSVPVPRMVAPSLKVTVPLGVPAPGARALTVAVKVTDRPDVLGLSEEARRGGAAGMMHRLADRRRDAGCEGTRRRHRRR